MKLPVIAAILLISVAARADEYDPAGRRDPFRPQLAQPGPGTSRFAELALTGIVRSPAGYRALAVEPGGKALLLTAGQRLYDGVVAAIDAGGVTFRQEVLTPGLGVEVKELRKDLYPVR